MYLPPPAQVALPFEEVLEEKTGSRLERATTMSNQKGQSHTTLGVRHAQMLRCTALLGAATLAAVLSSCSGSNGNGVQASGPAITVGIAKVVKKSLGRELTLSSELVPFQEIDVYAKESGYIKNLNVDYGTHVKAGEVMAVLEIPELEAQLH